MFPNRVGYWSKVVIKTVGDNLKVWRNFSFTYGNWNWTSRFSWFKINHITNARPHFVHIFGISIKIFSEMIGFALSAQVNNSVSIRFKQSRELVIKNITFGHGFEFSRDFNFCLSWRLVSLTVGKCRSTSILSLKMLKHLPASKSYLWNIASQFIWLRSSKKPLALNLYQAFWKWGPSSLALPISRDGRRQNWGTWSEIE